MSTSTFRLMDDPDYQRFVKAKHAGYPIFTIIAPDITASLTVDAWIKINLMMQSFNGTGLKIEQAEAATRSYFNIPRYHAGFDEYKLDGAATIARAMDAWPVKKLAD